MARSSYVYTVWLVNLPIAGFTVKHELVSWLKRQDAPQDYRIARLRDGTTPGPVQFLSASELTGEEYPPSTVGTDEHDGCGIECPHAAMDYYASHRQADDTPPLGYPAYASNQDHLGK